MKASSSNLRYADNNDAIDDHIEVVKTVDDHDVVDVDSENANGMGDEKTVDNEKKGVLNVNYMCLTAHWVDDDWVLRKKILNFCPIANHRGDTIGKMVYQCLQKWG
ncbi:hypothetical protein Tco_1024993, partial [Tanacetum coccineum]